MPRQSFHDSRLRRDLLKQRLRKACSGMLSTLNPNDQDVALSAFDHIFELSSTTIAMLARDGEIRQLCQVFAHVFYDEASADENFLDLAEFASALEAEADSLLNAASRLNRLTQGSDSSVPLQDFAASLSALLGHACRVRFYSIDIDNCEYIGLASLGMQDGFADAFEGAKQIPILEPPYVDVKDTLCSLLTAESIERSYSSHEGKPIRDWYRKWIFSDAPETYTWHFTSSGCVPYSVVRTIAQPAPTMWALSIDSGRNNSDFSQRRCTRARIRMIDALLRGEVGRSLAEGIARFGSKDNILDEAHLTTAAAIDTYPNDATNTSFTSNDGAPVIDSPTLDLGLAGYGRRAIKHEAVTSNSEPIDSPTLLGPFDCIPGKQPWIFSPLCAVARRVADEIDSLCSVDGPTGVFLAGPTGSGKNLLLMALFELSRVLKGAFISVTLANQELNALKLKGAAKGMFTQQGGNFGGSSGDVKSVFQIADGGLVVFPDLIRALEEGRPIADVLDVLWNAVAGETVAREHDFKSWVNKAIVAATGPEYSFAVMKERYPDLLVRFINNVTIPGWKDLDELSRRAILRWHVLELAKKRGAAQIRVAECVYDWFVKDTDGSLAVTNMRGAWARFQRIRASTNVANEVLELSPASFLDWPSNSPSDTNGHWLELGGQEFENRLVQSERLILDLARCSIIGKHSCISERNSRWEDVLDNSMADQGSTLDTYYLLLAAGRVTGECDSNDMFGIRPGIHQRHFPNGRNYIVTAKLKDFFDATPSDFRGLGDKKVKGSGHAGRAFPLLASHVRKNARRLQEIVERIACAYPPFFHVVPLWDSEWKNKSLLLPQALSPDQNDRESNSENGCSDDNNFDNLIPDN